MTSTSELVVRTGHQLSADFFAVAGQQGVTFRQAPLTPHQRFWLTGGALCVLEPFGYDLIHSFNAIPLAATKPWLVTFEDYLPRLPEDRPAPRLERLLTQRLISRGCRGVLAMSEYAMRQLQHQHRDDPHLAEILAKTKVVHPGCRTRAVAPHAARPESAPLRLLSVGSDWARKGFPATLLAHRELRARGVPVETTLISSLRVPDGDYVGPDAPQVLADYLRLLDQPGLTHIAGSDNQRVLTLMDQVDYFVFPTFHDTFGYVMIEAMAGATPVIGTNTCAVPEVLGAELSELLIPFSNEDHVGKWRWLYRNTDPGYVDAYVEQTERSASTITDMVERLSSQRDLVQHHSELALVRAREEFSHQALAARLEPIYASAVARS